MHGIKHRTTKMARILHNDDWYDELGSGSLYETEFERIFQQYVPRVYPGFIAVPFKKTVYSDDASARADLALIRSDYLGWWVVEVERAEHSLSNHVLPQIRTLANAYYGYDEAAYMAEKSKQLDRDRLYDMIRGDQPRMLVVVDMPCDDWKPALKENSAELAVFQIFRSERDRYLVRINGYYPTIEQPARSLCHFEQLLPNLLKVQKPAILPSNPSSQISVYYQGKLTFWRRIDTADQVWLIPLARLDLDATIHYELILDSDTLALHPIQSKRR